MTLSPCPSFILAKLFIFLLMYPHLIHCLRTTQMFRPNTEYLSPVLYNTPISAHPTSSPSTQHPPPLHDLETPTLITSVLDHFTNIFHKPNSLPPTRPISHHIHFLPNLVLVNIKPYRYPHYQKTKLEQQIASTLESGLIRPNFSAFSSPILLVKKKDGSWRCCIGYRALNAITVKDRFPMPTIDELLDELGHASFGFPS